MTGPQEIERTLLRLVDERGEGKTICPSEVARAIAGDEAFRPLMEPVREVAARLADAGRISVLQGGRPVDVRHARGPVRLGPPRS